MITTRTVCPGCGGDVVVLPSGAMDKHPGRAIGKDQQGTIHLPCPWAGKPAPIVETRGPLAQLELLGSERG